MPKSEHRIQDGIRVAVSEQCPGVIFRTNAGVAWQGDKVFSKEFGQYVLINLRPYRGLPEGFPDLLYIGPEKATSFVEVKTDKGRASEAQNRFHAMLQRFGHKICIARSAEEAVSFINSRET